MSVVENELDSHFNLDIVAGGLEGFVPPAEPFDPRGDWELSYRVCTLTKNCDCVGRLHLKRTTKGRKQHSLRVTYEKYMPEGYRQNVTAELVCDTDDLATPDAWTYRSNIAAPDGQLLADLTSEHSAKCSRRSIRITDQTSRRKISPPSAYTVNWALFEAVQRLPREPFQPIRFTLLDHFDQLKPNQTLSYRTSIEVQLGWKKVQQKRVEELPKGKVTKTRWARKGGRLVKLHAYDHLGEGIVPWVYWVDDEGRLLFVIAGLEAYLLDSWQEA